MVRGKPIVFGGVMLFLILCVSHFSYPLTSDLTPSKTWTYPDGYDPHGGYVDRVTFLVHSDDMWWFPGLEANLFYAWDESVPAANIEELEAISGIEATTEPGDLYRMFCLNCGRFPTNITAYRQAMAYALDKVAVIQASTGGLAFLQDCALPIRLGNWTFEDILIETYYDQDIDKANATLEAAGFRDLDGNGWRDFDKNNNSIFDAGDIIDQDFAVELYHTAGHAPSGNAVELAAQGLTLCGLMASVEALDFYLMIDRIEAGDWWLGCFTFSDVNSPEILYDMFHSSTANSQWYFGGYNNSIYDMYAENMMAATSQGEANDWAWLCQYQLWQDVPMIVCYNDVYTHAYRTDDWEGYINMATRNRICNGYSLVQLRLKESAGGPFGCFPTEYFLSLNDGLDTTNWLMSYGDSTSKVFQLVYEELWTRSPYDLSPQPGLAYAWEVQPTVASGDIQDGEKYTFHLYENATWHDGLPVTATDVAFSVTLALVDPYDAEKYQNIYKTNIVDASTIELYTNRSGYLEWLRSTGFTVYPVHIWDNMMVTGDTVTDWVPTVSELVGSGPYVFVTCVPGQYVVLERHVDWHFGIDHPPRDPCPPSGIDGYPLLGIPIMIILIEVCILSILLFRRSRTGSKKWS